MLVRPRRPELSRQRNVDMPLSVSAISRLAASASGRMGRGGAARQISRISARAYTTRKLEYFLKRFQIGVRSAFSRRPSATSPRWADLTIRE